MGGYEKALELWRRKNITTDAELAEALNAFGIAFAYHSGKIENDNVTYHDTKEIFEHNGVIAYTGDLRTLFEIRNAKEAYELFLCAFRDRRPLDESFIKELQFCLTKKTYDTRCWQLGERPGEYKRHRLRDGPRGGRSRPGGCGGRGSGATGRIAGCSPGKCVDSRSIFPRQV